MANIFVHILNWNDKPYLPDLIDSLKKQTAPNFTVRILDNGSTDGTHEELMRLAPTWSYARNAKNLGFAPGHNLLFKATLERMNGEYRDQFIALANADMIIDDDCLNEMAKALQQDQSLGAVQPKIFRVVKEVEEGGLSSYRKTEILDSTGLVLRKNWRMEDRGAGEVDVGQYDDKLDLIGPCGAMMMFRAEALVELLNFDGEVFDGDFYLYREDCDLALRLRRRGWKTRFVPTAKAWHYRGMFGEAKRSLLRRLFDRRKQRPIPAAYSTRNQLFFIVKNLTLTDWILAFPRIFFNETGRVLYGLAFEPVTRKLLLSSFSLAIKMLKKRRMVLSQVKTPEAEIRQYAI